MSDKPDSIARRWASFVVARRGRPVAALVLLLLAALVATSGALVIERLPVTGGELFLLVVAGMAAIGFGLLVLAARKR